MNTDVRLKSLLVKYKELKEKNKKVEDPDYQGINLLQFSRTDEMGLSSILGYFLDPRENHGQGKSFLTAFLKKLSLEQFADNFDDAFVYLEHSTEFGRRHDIFIQGLNAGKTEWVISIENKLRGAVDQDKQLESYYKDLQRYHSENYFLLYLPSYECEPSIHSISNWNEMLSQNKGKVWTPLDLVSWLNDVSIQSEKLAIFVNDVKHFLKTEIMNMSKLDSELLKLVLENKENIELTLDLFSLKNEFYNELKSKLVEQLRDKFENDKLFDKNEWELVTEENNYKYELIKLIPNNYPFVIHFECASTGMYYGFKWKDKDNKEEHNKYLPFILKNPEGTKSDWWGKWINCPTKPLNLQFWDRDTWLAIDTENQELASQLWELVHNLWAKFIAELNKL